MIHWGPSPDIHILGASIPWYSLTMATGIIVAVSMMWFFFRREHAPLEDFFPLGLWTIVGGFLFARLAHCFFYDWEYFREYPLEILYVWKGGLSSHGASLGIPLSIYIYSRYFGKVYYWWVYDRLAIALPVTCIFIRLGNLMNSELYGKPTELPWGFKFTAVDSLTRHPSQIYDILFCLLTAIILWIGYARFQKGRNFGWLTGVCLVIMAGFRFALDGLKDDEFAGALSVSQWLSIPFIVLGVFIILQARRRKWK